MRAGLVGAGMLGRAVGLHLLESGYDISVYNRTRSKTQELEQAGADIAKSPAAVAQASDVVITCVTDAAAVRDIAFGPGSITSAGKRNITVAEMSTIGPADSTAIAQRYKQHGISMLRVPVMGGPNVAIKGKLTMMVSGDRQLFERYKDLWDTIAEQVFYLGASSEAHAVKLAMNLQIAMTALALSEGITLTRVASVDPKVFLEVLNSTYFATGMSRNKAYGMIKGEISPTFTLANLKKDLGIICQAASGLGLKLPMASEADRVYRQALESGLGDLDYTAIINYIKKDNM